MSAELTEKQAALLAFMRAFLAANDSLPSMSTCARHFGWASDNNVYLHLLALKKKGVIERNEQGGWRFVRPAVAQQQETEAQCS